MISFRASVIMFDSWGLVVLLGTRISIAQQHPSSRSFSYLVSMMRMGKVENQFCANLLSENGKYTLKSDAHHDIVLTPEAGNVTFSSGPYSLTLIHQNLRKETFPVIGTVEGNIVVFTSKGPVDMRLSLQNCSGDVPSVAGWYSPFKEDSRQAFVAIKRRIAGEFGDFRTAGENGHRHAGVDLRGNFAEAVYPVASGLVLARSFKDLNGMVLIQHRLSDDTTVYSKYIHIQDIKVDVGQQVSSETRLGLVFDRATFKKSGYKYNHLHLEIRKDYEDKGTDSSYSKDMMMLEEHCYDPVLFLQRHMFLSTVEPLSSKVARRTGNP